MDVIHPGLTVLAIPTTQPKAVAIDENPRVGEDGQGDDMPDVRRLMRNG